MSRDDFFNDDSPLGMLLGKMEELEDTKRMHMEADKVAIDNLLKHELTMEQLATLARIIDAINSEMDAGFWKGYICAIGNARHEAEHPHCGIE